ncbi:sigma-70 family RNA polymerase sigma factor [Sphingomonas xanthus]|uniref:Sigma-70 family RNA polymerase sigma factor n=1 Tax=Sphingomonas xanthus TaxID=2594473 RepID=A0A516ISY8_9SPHN|nr:sigma-70 family RNA polymerase sigma factor [Sphingomonas xanthus]QDP19944.1 sigma-70 family RNA polymerase sigma factor [Sphingomonas xanthus]
MILADDDLRRLMRAGQRGDKACYAAALKASAHWLGCFFRKRIAPAMVDDLVQETLASLHVKRASYDSARPFYPWLAAIARYRWIDQLRRLERAPEALLDREPAVPSDEEPILSRLSIERLMMHLTQAQASAITLTRIEGLSIKEVASLTGQSESLVKVNVFRGLKKLAALVESE